MEKRLRFQASHDSLTSLINRREFEVRLQQTIRKAQTEEVSHPDFGRRIFVKNWLIHKL